jgi:hypothetical protein
MKRQETLEEAAEKQWINVHRTGVLGFIEGAKWQQERNNNMYTDKEVVELIYKITAEYGNHYGIMIDEEMINELFEKFKTK